MPELKTKLCGAILALPDSIVHGGNRAPWGDTYAVGQVGGADLDLNLWNESNAYGPYRGSNRWGWWGFSFAMGERRLASNLSISEATAYEGRDEIARCPAATALHFTHGVFDAIQSEAGAAAWEWQLISCSTGLATSGTYSTPATGASIALGTPANGSYMLRVRVALGRPSYTGLPTDYRAVTGQSSDAPSAYRWTAESGKSYLYDPIWNVGAAPADAAHPLRLQREELLAEGKDKKHPEWVSKVMLIGADGEPEAQGGEWSALKVRVGSGAWIGDLNCHANAAWPCVWKALTSSLQQIVLEPRLRAAGCAVPHEGSLWIGGFLAGRSGPQPCLVKYDGPTAHGTSNNTPQWSIFCECAMAGAKMVNSITWVDGVLHAVTACDVLLLDELTDSLIATHPGGRCAGTLHGTGGDTFVRTTETDFSVNPKFAWGFNVMLSGAPKRERVWRGTAHHVFGALGFRAQKAWYIEENGAPGTEQAMAYFNGQSRDLISKWDKEIFDLAQVGIAGQYAFGFGHKPDLGPVAVRFDTSGIDKIRREFSFALHVRNVATGLSADNKRQTLFVVGKGIDESGQPADGWGLYESDPNDGTTTPTGEPKACLFWNGVSEKFSIETAVAVSKGVDPDKLFPFLTWKPIPGEPAGGVWMTSTAAPADDTPYLELVPAVSTVISYHKPGSVTLPYDPDVWPRVCFKVNSDGTIGPTGEPTPTDEDPTDTLDNMPAGTTVRIVRYPRAGTALTVPVEIASAHGRVTHEGEPIAGFALDELYPWLWFSVDGELEVADSPSAELSADDLLALKEFTVRARGIDRRTALPLPAGSSIRCAYLIPPGYEVPAKLLKDVS